MDHHRELTDILELHFIELAKFRRNKPHQLRTPFEKWLHVLKFGELYESGLAPVPEALKQEEGIEMALESMRKACASDEVREIIELRMKAMRDEATRLEAAMRQGLAQGLEQGRQEGRRALVETACRVRDAGISTETILKMTGLRPEELDP